MFNTLRTAGYARTLNLFVLVVFTALLWALAFLMLGNFESGGSTALAYWTTASFAAALTLLVAFRFGQRITARLRRVFHPPAPIHIDVDGIHQSGTEEPGVDLKWEDIRLVQHKGAAHLIRGADKGQKIEISTRLEGHRAASAFLKFAFVLRQEIGDDWRGLLTEVKARLEGPGFHFHYDRDRTNSVLINSQGIRHSSADGVESEMPWALMRESIMDEHKDHLRFRHTGTKTSIAIPRGTDSDDVVDELIRWALHTAPDFSHSSS